MLRTRVVVELPLSHKNSLKAHQNVSILFTRYKALVSIWGKEGLIMAIRLMATCFQWL